MSLPPPPKPAPKPGKIKVFRALYNYAAQQADELSFQEGDILYVTEEASTDTSGWWQARCGSKQGLIPYNYVSEQAESIDYPLHEAARRGNQEFLQECLQNKVSVNGLDKSGSTALYWAAHSGHKEMLTILLSQPNVDISSQNKLGDTPLHAAAWKGNTQCAEMLLQQGANVVVLNNEKKSPAQLATNPETAALLKRASLLQPISAEDYDPDDEESD